MATTLHPPMPPAGTYAYPPPGDYYSPQPPRSYHSPPPYVQQPQQFTTAQPYQPPYPDQQTYQPANQYQYPNQLVYPPLSPQQYSPPQQYREFQPAPPQQGGFHSHPPEKTWNPEEIWNEYNHPPDPQYGIPESQREQFTAGSQTWPNNSGHPDQAGQEGGERGLGATVVGGGAGAFLGHKMLKNHGTLGAVGGLALGALAANAWEHHEKAKKEHRREERAFGDGYADGEGRRSVSRGTDGDDGYYEGNEEYEREDNYYEPPRYHHYHHHDRDYEDDYNREDDYREEYYDRRDDL